MLQITKPICRAGRAGLGNCGEGGLIGGRQPAILEAVVGHLSRRLFAGGRVPVAREEGLLLLQKQRLRLRTVNVLAVETLSVEDGAASIAASTTSTGQAMLLAHQVGGDGGRSRRNARTILPPILALGSSSFARCSTSSSTVAGFSHGFSHLPRVGQFAGGGDEEGVQEGKKSAQGMTMTMMTVMMKSTAKSTNSKQSSTFGR